MKNVWQCLPDDVCFCLDKAALANVLPKNGTLKLKLVHLGNEMSFNNGKLRPICRNAIGHPCNKKK